MSGSTDDCDTSTDLLTAASLSALGSDLFDKSTRSKHASPSTLSTLTSLEPTPKKWRGWINLDEEEIPPAFASPPPPGQASEYLQRARAQTDDLQGSPTRKVARCSASAEKILFSFVDEGSAYSGAGLYWLPTSDGDRRPRPATPSGRIKRHELDWRKIKNPASFPLPIYWGKRILDEGLGEDGFWLPMSLVRDVDDKVMREGKGILSGNGQLSSTYMRALSALEGSRKPDPFRHISKNFFTHRRPERSAHGAVCVCRKPTKSDESGCGDDCINRLMQYTCDAKTCPCGAQCSNVPLNQRDGVPEGKDGLRVVWTGDRGFGLKTSVPIAAGDYIIEYRGEIISHQESWKRVSTIYKDTKSFYFLDYDGYEVIDAGLRGNAARFINHSCGPNSKVVSWKKACWEEYEIGIFALEDIPAGTEITYDYGWQDFASLNPASSKDASTPNSKIAADRLRQRCYCGSSQCSGFLGGKKTGDKGKKKKKTTSKAKGNVVGPASTSSASAPSTPKKRKVEQKKTTGKAKKGVMLEQKGKRKAVGVKA